MSRIAKKVTKTNSTIATASTPSSPLCSKEEKGLVPFVAIFVLDGKATNVSVERGKVVEAEALIYF